MMELHDSLGFALVGDFVDGCLHLGVCSGVVMLDRFQLVI